jgi:tetratricopeptide (TPR) repeat protein
LERLRADLSGIGLSLRVVRFSREEWNLTALLETDGVDAPPGVVAVVGLEDTPGIVPEPGAPPRRPPALALLNQAREALRKRLRVPLLLWCDPLTYTALQEHAPDFFDYFTALFTFLDAAPVRTPAGTVFEVPPEDEPTLTVQRQGISSRAAVAFYEDQVEQRPESTPERARALLGLAQALRSLRGPDFIPRLTRAEAAVREALTLLSPRNEGAEWARGQVILGNVLFDLPVGDRGENLRRAIACYEAALRVYTEADFPQDWANTEYNRALTFDDLAEVTGDNTLRQRIVAGFRAAARGYRAVGLEDRAQEAEERAARTEAAMAGEG